MKAMAIQDRLVLKINKTDSCWIWTAAKNTKGYGLIKYQGKMHKAHRISYELAYGQIPNGLILLHKCDNPACVRPDHLQTGTYQDNTLDMVVKGRGKLFGGDVRVAQAKGALNKRNKTLKITLPIVLKEIRLLIGQGIKPTLRRCWLISGYHAVHHYVIHTEIVAMARRCE